MHFKKIGVLSGLALACCFMVSSVSAAGELPQYNRSYTYRLDNSSASAVEAPEGYSYSYEINSELLGVEIRRPAQVDSDNSQNLYIIDSELNRLLKVDSGDKVAGVAETFNGGDTFSSPQGVSVGSDGKIYVADTDNGRIVVFSPDLKFIKIIDEPDEADSQYDYEYKPLCVEADLDGRVYVIAENQTQGIFQFDQKGQFIGYLGATKVYPSLWDLIYRRIASREQLKGMMKLIPTEYSSMDLDEDNFVYCTISTYSASRIRSAIRGGSSVTPIRRLNQRGSDILHRKGTFSPVGDLSFIYDIHDPLSGPSAFVDIAAYQGGIYSALDATRCRIFTYSGDGDLLYIFGGRGSDMGMLQHPTSLTYRFDNILVSDSASSSIHVFKPTRYAGLIIEGINRYNSGEYEKEYQTWTEVLNIYSGNRIAYKSIGRSYYNKGDYKRAMEYFRLADNRIYYSKALEKYIQHTGSQYAVIALPVITALVLIFIIWRHLKKKGLIAAKKRKRDFLVKYKNLNKLLREIKYAVYLSLHPFDGFWDLKYEKRGSVLSATVILILAVIANIFRIRYTAYLFNYSDFTQTSALYKGISGLIVLIGLWCVSNWCLTTLMDGKGKFKDIYIFSCYALWPIIIIFPAITISSHFLYLNSASFLSILVYAAVAWTGFLILSGTAVTHHYSLSKTLLTILLSAVGMMLLVFLALLAFSIGQKMIQFLQFLLREIYLRV